MSCDMQYTPSPNHGVAVIDLRLAASYAPGIICVAKSVALLVVCHILAVVFLMTLTERCVVLCIVLYLDRAHHREYIIDTNACVCVSFFGLVVNELRVMNTFSLAMWPWTWVCSLVWCVYSCFLLNVGEAYISAVACRGVDLFYGKVVACGNTVLNAILSERRSGTTPPGHNESECYDKNSNGKNKRSSHFTPLLLTAVLLFLSCNVPIVVEFDNNLEMIIRMFCFVSTSLLWLYTLNVEQMQSNTITSFTPCINRFMVLLLTGPVFLMVIVYIVMISMIIYRGWDLLTNAVSSVSPASGSSAAYPVAGAASSPVHPSLLSQTHENTTLRASCAASEYDAKPSKHICIIGMPSQPPYPEEDTPFDPEAAFAEMSRLKGGM
jgi:hypothetical protein